MTTHHLTLLRSFMTILIYSYTKFFTPSPQPKKKKNCYRFYRLKDYYHYCHHVKYVDQDDDDKFVLKLI